MFKVWENKVEGLLEGDGYLSDVSWAGITFTRKPLKSERFIQLIGLRMNKALVKHPELKVTYVLCTRLCVGVVTKIYLIKFF